ncbi:MAG: hypothetical protein JWN40_558 [Phycisphaerales bacterium]|nr:hypothetical protein [Phycisphaerales bacterium]
MIIDRQSLKDSRGWIILSLLTLLICSVAYFIYAARATNGPSGGSWPGLTFGGIGTAIILFAWALTVRKWRRSARWGKTYSWLQGHVYLSIVSYPVILYHAGFHWGGPLTRVLMWAFTICYFSGLLVLLVQQIVPRLLLSDVPLETIYEQIDHVSRKNLAAADELIEVNAAVAVAVPDLGEDEFQTTVPQRAGPTRQGPSDLKTFYDGRVRPFLAQGLGPVGQSKRAAVVATWMATARQAIFPNAVPAPTAQEFADLRRQMTDTLWPVLDALEGYTEERRQFTTQKRLQHLLHGWLLIHVPASWVMIVLLPLHAIMAVRYL